MCRCQSLHVESYRPCEYSGGISLENYKIGNPGLTREPATPILFLGWKDHLHVLWGPQTCRLHSQRPCQDIRAITFAKPWNLNFWSKNRRNLQAGSGEKTVSGTSKRVRVGKDRRKEQWSCMGGAHYSKPCSVSVPGYEMMAFWGQRSQVDQTCSVGSVARKWANLQLLLSS